MVQRFTSNHPSVVALDRQIAEVQKSKEELNRALKTLPDTELKSVQLMRDVQVANDMYVLLLNKSQELKIVKSGTVGNVRIVDDAVVDVSRPVWPQTRIILFVGMVIGGLMGLGLSGIRRALDRGIEDPEEVERQFGLPVFATVPHSEWEDRKHNRIPQNSQARELLAECKPTDVTVESIRSLRTGLQFAVSDGDRNRNVLMLAGLRPQVGKSFLSANLSCVLAASGKRVLLMDGDMRRGHLHTELGFERGAGLSEVCSGQISLREAAKTSRVQNLDILTTGMLPPNPAELLLTTAFRTAVEAAATEYDWVVIDAPPILAVTDACLIGRRAGLVLLVLKAGQHPEREINLGLGRLRNAQIEVAGVVMNDLRMRSRAYMYGRYGYAQAYKYE